MSLRLAQGPLMQQSTGLPFGGHDGVASWVSTNSSKVLAYYPMSDASASGTMSDDSGNGRDGTYGAGIGSRTISGETVADFTGGSTSIATVSDAAWLDSIEGVAMVIELDTFTDYNAPLSRDSHSSGDRNWQLRFGSSATKVPQFLQVGSGNPSATIIYGITVGSATSLGWVRTSGSNYGMLGADVAAASSDTPIFETGSSPLRFGHVLSNNSPGQLVDGAIGSVVLLNSTADEDDLLAIHQAFYGDTV